MLFFNLSAISEQKPFSSYVLRSFQVTPKYEKVLLRTCEMKKNAGISKNRKDILLIRMVLKDQINTHRKSNHDCVGLTKQGKW